MTESAKQLKFVGNVQDLADSVGTTWGPTRKVRVSQERIQMFADATEDHQWIHVDCPRAADGPFGTTIAHGYLTLSLIPTLLADQILVEGSGMGINYGLNRVRFPTPLPSGTEVEAYLTLQGLQLTPTGALATIDVTISVAGGADKPTCVAQVVVLYTAQPATGSRQP